MQNQEQIVASDPSHSVWVSASAGTGKTKVLTDRVLRLLLEDVPFDKILCLTFTNAAATEMHNRISAACLKWQSNVDSLEFILGRAPSKEEVFRAKQLFSRLMLATHQLSIHTIHSFCQKILQSFPFEAGLQPGFNVISDIQSDEIIEQVVQDLAAASSEESVKHLLQNLHENSFVELIREILSDQMYFQELFQQFSTSEEYESFLRHEIDVIESSETVMRYFMGIIPIQEGMQYLYNLNPNLYGENSFENLRAFFLTANGDAKKKLITKKESDANPGLERNLYKIQTIIYQTDQKIKKLNMIFATRHIYEVAKIAIEKYNFYKKYKGYLDYDDLIYYTKELLTNSDMRDWVLYKLDGGVMHLLIDEAQDTSPEQWQIIEAIMREFYSGSTSISAHRTIFIVGDEKQSIYSFQGADIENFNRFNDYIRTQMNEAVKSYKDVELKWSYRSGSAILDFVSQVWSLGNNPHLSLKPFRDIKGTVEIWPLYNQLQEKAALFWPLINEMKISADSAKLLAHDIAKYIKNYIASGMVLSSTGKPAKADDFMILVRRRNEFMEEVIKALKHEGVDVGGMDRMVLTDHIAVQDILSLAKYALMPMDELNLAALLKSPIVGMNDLELRMFTSSSNRVIPEICIIASQMIDQTLFNFFYNLIEIMGLRAVLARVNGPSTHDVLDEMLNLVMQFEKQHSSSLQEFIYWIESKDIQVKHDSSEAGFVRVMTIHGAKGLQSPVVILADTTSLPTGQNHLVWADGKYLWLGGAQNSNEQYNAIKESVEASNYQEYLRLLYVALTRAEDHLVIVGHSIREKIAEGCFYDIANRAILSMDFQETMGKKWFGNEVIIKDCEMLSSSSSIFTSQNIQKLDFDSEITPYRSVGVLCPQNSCMKMNGYQSPLHSRMSLNYGQLIHKILEDSVNTSNFAFSPSHPMIRTLPQEMQDMVLEKLSALFRMKEFVDLVKNVKIHTEVSIGYNDNGKTKIGRIDLLAMKDSEIIIIDYKTDKNVPKSAAAIPKNYMTQMQFYSDALKKIYPDYQVITKILWIEELVMMGVANVA